MTTTTPSQVAPTRERTGAPAIQVAAASRTYGHGASAVHALDQIDLEVPVGGFTCLVGASGCGKSTLLSILAGLDRPTSGEVTVDGRTALMFQDSALFPWLTVAGNIDLALRLNGMPRRQRRPRIEELLASVHLSDFIDKRPHELSGGMRQRVAIARAFAQEADVLLMDEPFGALDAMTRDVLHAEVERLWLERGFTVVFVTHNVREAVRLADRIVLLSSRPGRVLQQIDVPIARPRRIESPEVSSLASDVTDLLRSEVRRHGA